MNENRAILIVFAVVLLGIGFTVVRPVFQSSRVAMSPNKSLADRPNENAETHHAVSVERLQPEPTGPASLAASDFLNADDVETASVDTGPYP